MEMEIKFILVFSLSFSSFIYNYIILGNQIYICISKGLYFSSFIYNYIILVFSLSFSLLLSLALSSCKKKKKLI